MVSSIIFALRKMGALEITISNRTKNKAEIIKSLFDDLAIVKWERSAHFDMVINATSLGLNNNDELNLDFQKLKKKSFFMM